MDWLQFVASLVDSLAWPASVFGAIFLVRKQLLTLFPFLKKLKYKDFEVEFSEAIRDLAKKSPQALPPPTDLALPYLLPEGTREKLEAIAEFSPRSAILEAWLLVESSAADVIQKRGIAERSRYPGPMRVGQNLRKAEVLNSEQVEIFEKLRALRNQAVHVAEAEFETSDVQEYVGLALSLAAYLERKANEF